MWFVIHVDKKMANDYNANYRGYKVKQSEEKTDSTKRSFAQYFKDLTKMFFVFVKVGAVTFGGGLAMLPILERELAEKRKWTTKEDLMDYYAIAQITPGIIAVNVATFLGYNHYGVFGGIITTLGVVTPSIIVISVIAAFLGTIDHIPQVQYALAGMNIAVAAMLTKVVGDFAKATIGSWKNVFGILLAVLAFVGVGIFQINSSIFIVFGAVSGLVLYALKTMRAKKKGILIENEAITNDTITTEETETGGLKSETIDTDGGIQ